MLIGSGLQAFASSGKFKPVALDQIRTAGNTAGRTRDIHANVVYFSAQPRGACHSQDTQNHPASAA
jgi:hypothetical protein